MKRLNCLLLLILSSMSAAEEEPPKVGNFSLRTSQQPGPLVGEAENIIDKGQKQLFIFADLLRGPDNYKSDLITSLLYGITDRFSVYVSLPFAPRNKEHHHHSSGWQDVFLQLEYAYYVKQTKAYVDQATIA